MYTRLVQVEYVTVTVDHRGTRICFLIDKPCSVYLALPGRAPPRPTGGGPTVVPTGTR